MENNSKLDILKKRREQQFENYRKNVRSLANNKSDIPFTQGDNTKEIDKQITMEENNIINAIEWFEHPQKPVLNTAVVVELDTGKLGIAQLDDNPNRNCWLIQGMGKLFWRSMLESVEKWRWMTANEIIEYQENKTLKIIENG